jgi:hypothetical protein
MESSGKDNEKNFAPADSPNKSRSYVRIGSQWVDSDSQKPLDPSAATPSVTVEMVRQVETTNPDREIVVAPLISTESSPIEAEEKVPDTAPVTEDAKGGEEIQGSEAQQSEADAPIPQEQNDGSSAAYSEDEKILNLYNEVLSTNNIMAEFRKDMQELSRKIENLSADTIVKLGEQASVIEQQKGQLDELTSKEVTCTAAIAEVILENSSLKKERQGWDAKAHTLEAEKDSLAQEIEALKNQILEQEESIKAKDAEKQGLIFAHSEAVEKLNADHVQAILDLEKQKSEEVDALNKTMVEQIQKALDNIEAFVPSKVCELFDYQIGEVGDVQSKWQSIYAYLCFINGNLRQDAFVKRFREFDAALYDAMRDTPDLLTECRLRVQKHINEELGKKTGGLQVCWPKIGEVCNTDHYTTTSDFGQRISEVISAMVYRKGDDGKVLCLNKGKVATA